MGESGDSSSPPEPAERLVDEDEALDESSPDSLDRRSSERHAVTWSVDCETEETFLYASIANISEMGIFVRTTDPLPIGTRLTLRFAPPGSGEAFVLHGIVQWVNLLREDSDNPNPGMGVCFEDLTPASRERIVDVIRTIAYLRDDLADVRTLN